jgi:DNA methylase
MESLFARRILIADRFDPTVDLVLHHGNCMEALRALPDGVIHLVVTSPPYNIGKVYEERSTLDAYAQMLSPIIAEIVRVLAPCGSLCWQTGNRVEDGEILPLDCFYYPIFKAHGLHLRNRIIWTFGTYILDASRLPSLALQGMHPASVLCCPHEAATRDFRPFPGQAHGVRAGRSCSSAGSQERDYLAVLQA